MAGSDAQQRLADWGGSRGSDQRPGPAAAPATTAADGDADAATTAADRDTALAKNVSASSATAAPSCCCSSAGGPWRRLHLLDEGVDTASAHAAGLKRALARNRVPHERPRLRERPNALEAEFAANAGLAAAAERQARVLGGKAMAVDADGARYQLTGDPVGERVIPGPHGRANGQLKGGTRAATP